MIWAILIFIGIPLWLVATLLFMLVRTHTKVQHIPGSVQCKVRGVTAGIPGLGPAYPRYTSTAHWVHAVLIVHAGTFLIRTLPIGVATLDHAPAPAEPSPRIKKIDQPVIMRLTTDAGAEIELVCATADAEPLSGPFGHENGHPSVDVPSPMPTRDRPTG
jgi:hypothetical protein